MLSSVAVATGDATMALSIRAARDVCSCADDDDDGIRKQRQQPPVDVLAAVASVRVWNKASTAATIDIHDDSGVAQLLVLGRTAVQRVVRSSLRRGDFVRWNGVSLKADANGDGTIVFYQSYSDSETVPWCRIASWQGRERLVLAPSTPAVMQTTSSCWQRLEAWYRQEHSSCIPPAPPPVQFRTLTELHDMIGVVSHVIATVTSMVRTAEQPIGRKRQRSSFVPKASTAASTTCYWLIALQQQLQQPVSSPPPTTLLRLDEDAASPQQHALRAVCQRSLAQHQALVLLHVVMQSTEDTTARILVCTEETVGRFATAVEHRMLRLPSSSSPPPCGLGPSTPDDAATTTSGLPPLLQEQPTTMTTTLYASIDDIQFKHCPHQDGGTTGVVSVREELLRQDPRSTAAATTMLLSHAAAPLTSSNREYTFHLRRIIDSSSSAAAAAATTVVVQASQRVLEEQLLCGMSSSHIIFVQDILRGLLAEAIVLRWTVLELRQETSSVWNGTTTTKMVVQSVVLPEL